MSSLLLAMILIVISFLEVEIQPFSMATLEVGDLLKFFYMVTLDMIGSTKYVVLTYLYRCGRYVKQQLFNP